MKQNVIIALALATLTLNPGYAALDRGPSKRPQAPLPASFSKPTTIEWGCPVAEVVSAKSATEAMDKIQKECLDQVRRSAYEKPDVLDVLHASVIWPDVDVVPAIGGYSLTGTFFLETLVLQKSRAED